MNKPILMIPLMVTLAAQGMELPKRTPIPIQMDSVSTPALELSSGWQFRPSQDAVYSPIVVPGEWSMQGFHVKDQDLAEYRTEVNIPNDWVGHTMRIRFEAVHASCQVYMNGVQIGAHEGGFVPFELDFSQSAKAGSNELLVKVSTGTIPDRIACMSQYAAHQVGGIMRKVHVFCTPRVFINDLWHETKVQNDTAVLTIHHRGEQGLGTVMHRLYDADGKVVAAAHAQGGVTTFAVAKAKLWTCETPYLYTLETECQKAIVRQKVGLREVAIKGNQLLVNHRPVKLLGVNRHDVYPTTGRAIADGFARKDVEWFKAANCNLIRTSHYPPSEEMLDACDELGMFVESEAAVCWIQHHASPIWKEWKYEDPKYLPYLLQPSLDQMVQYRNHPSILMWSIGNESRWSTLFEKVLDIAKQVDPTRPIVFHDQCWGDFNNAGSKADIANFHYPSPSQTKRWTEPSRPVWFGEYGHVQCYNRRELVADPGIRSDWQEPMIEMVNLMWQHPGCLGGAIWSGIDDVFVMPNRELRGYGHWGVIDAWRRKKPEFYATRRAYAPVVFSNLSLHDANQIHVVIENRFQFLSLAQVKIEWQCAGLTGPIRVVADPHQRVTAMVEVPWPKDQRLTLVATDPMGRVVSQACFDHPERQSLTVSDGFEMWNVKDEGVLMAGQPLPWPKPLIVPLNDSGGMDTPAGTVLSADIPAFCPGPEGVRVLENGLEGSQRRIRYHTEWGEAELVIQLQENHALRVDYTLKAKSEINPRQAGVVFELPDDYQMLEWQRVATGDWVDDESLDRLDGVARAGVLNGKDSASFPKGLWKDDDGTSSLGSVDFRSSRTHVRWAKIISETKKDQLWVGSIHQGMTIRTWMSHGKTYLFVAGFHTGGADPFFAPHYSSERRPLKPGDSVSGSFSMGLLRKR